MPHLMVPLSFHHILLLGIHQAGPVHLAGGDPLLLGPPHPQGPPFLTGAQILSIYRTVIIILKRDAVESRGLHHRLQTVWTQRNSTGIWSLSLAVAPQLLSKTHMRDLKHLHEPEQLSTAQATCALVTAVKYHHPETAIVVTVTPHKGNPTPEMADRVLLRPPGRGPHTPYSASHNLVDLLHQDEVQTLKCVAVQCHMLQLQKLTKAMRGIKWSAVTEAGAMSGEAWMPYWSLNPRRLQKKLWRYNLYIKFYLFLATLAIWLQSIFYFSQGWDILK